MPSECVVLCPDFSASRILDDGDTFFRLFLDWSSQKPYHRALRHWSHTTSISIQPICHPFEASLYDLSSKKRVPDSMPLW